MTARDDAIKATVQFARDTDDPTSALGVFRQVLAEVEEQHEWECYHARLMWGQSITGGALGRAVALCHGALALVERCMEPWDEDTWKDFLHDEQDGRACPDCNTDDNGRCDCTCDDCVVAGGTRHYGHPTPHHETAGDPDDYAADDLPPVRSQDLYEAERLVAMADCDDDEDCDRPPTDALEAEMTVGEVDDDMVPGSW